MGREGIEHDTKDALDVAPRSSRRILEAHDAPRSASVSTGDLRRPADETLEAPASYEQLVTLAVTAYARCRCCAELGPEAARALGVEEDGIVEMALLVAHADHMGERGRSRDDVDRWKREVRAACDAIARGTGILSVRLGAAQKRAL